VKERESIMKNRFLSCASALGFTGAVSLVSGSVWADQGQAAAPYHYVLEAFPVSQTDLTED
jgi:hypothetical protein